MVAMLVQLKVETPVQPGAETLVQLVLAKQLEAVLALMVKQVKLEKPEKQVLALQQILLEKLVLNQTHKLLVKPVEPVELE
jgi:hypothetical protein